jgi:hypothetical protein
MREARHLVRILPDIAVGPGFVIAGLLVPALALGAVATWRSSGRYAEGERVTVIPGGF